MFKIKGKLAGKETTVTWDAGKVDHPQLRKAIADYISTSGEEYLMIPAMQEVRVSFDDPLFCYEIMARFFDIIEEVEGDTGLITFDDDPNIKY